MDSKAIISEKECMYCGSRMQLKQKGKEYKCNFESVKCMSCRALLYAKVD